MLVSLHPWQPSPRTLDRISSSLVFFFFLCNFFFFSLGTAAVDHSSCLIALMTSAEMCFGQLTNPLPLLLLKSNPQNKSRNPQPLVDAYSTAQSVNHYKPTNGSVCRRDAASDSPLLPLHEDIGTLVLVSGSDTSQGFSPKPGLCFVRSVSQKNFWKTRMFININFFFFFTNSSHFLVVDCRQLNRWCGVSRKYTHFHTFELKMVSHFNADRDVGSL